MAEVGRAGAPARRREIVVIGASAGGVEAMREVAQGLPRDLDAAIFCVMHHPPGAKSYLPEILTRAGPLPALHAEDGERIRPGRIYVGPPDHHMLLADGHVRLSRGPHHNRHRPAVDPLFGSAARSYGPGVIGVVLSGTLDDGTAGLAKIKGAGGVALVQDPATAAHAGMPESARTHVAVDRVVPLDRMAAAIVEAAREPVPDVTLPREPRLDEEFEGDLGMRTDMEEIGAPSVYACPECHGTLWEFDEEGVLQFRCRVGHSFSTEGLLEEHDGSLEFSLWAALRALEENASLRRRLAKRMRDRKAGRVADQYDAKASQVERHASTLRELLLSKTGPTARQERE